VTSDEQFAAYLDKGEIRFQQCSACGTRRGTPRPVCHTCLSRESSWQPAAEAGSIVSFIVAHEAIATQLEPPYIVAHVELDDGVRFTANLLGDAEPSVGMRVRAVIAERAGRRLLQFEPVDD
jgi:uncharacterized OB-fold protein